MKRLTIWKCGSKELCPRNPYWMSLRGLVLQGVWSRHFSCGVTLKYHSKTERTIGFINHSLQNVHGFHHWLLTPEHCSGLRCDFQPDRSRHFEPVHLPRSFDAKPNTVTFQVWNLVCLVDLIFPWTEFFSLHFDLKFAAPLQSGMSTKGWAVERITKRMLQNTSSRRKNASYCVQLREHGRMEYHGELQSICLDGPSPRQLRVRSKLCRQSVAKSYRRRSQRPKRSKTSFGCHVVT